MIERTPVRRDCCMCSFPFPSCTMRSSTVSQHRLMMPVESVEVTLFGCSLFRKCKDPLWWLMTVCFPSCCRQTYGLAFSGRETAELCWIDESNGIAATIGNSSDSHTPMFQVKTEERVWIRSAGRESRGANATMGASPDALLGWPVPSGPSSDPTAEFGSQIIHFFPNFTFLMLLNQLLDLSQMKGWMMNYDTWWWMSMKDDEWWMCEYFQRTKAELPGLSWRNIQGQDSEPWNCEPISRRSWHIKFWTEWREHVEVYMSAIDYSKFMVSSEGRWNAKIQGCNDDVQGGKTLKRQGREIFGCS